VGETALALWKDAPRDFFFTADVTLAPGATLALRLRGAPDKKSAGSLQSSPHEMPMNYDSMRPPRWSA
jgi:hypothetical protein